MNPLARPDRDQPDWMIVYTTHNLPEAHIVAGRLHHEGIPAMIHHQAGRDAIGIHIGRLGAVHIVVRAVDYDMALRLLDEPEPDELPHTTDDIYFDLEDDDDDDHE